MAASVAATIDAALKRQGLNPYRAAKEAGLPENSIRYVIEGRNVGYERLKKVCDFLGLDFHIGFPGESENGPAETQILRLLSDMSVPHRQASMQLGVQLLVDLVNSLSPEWGEEDEDGLHAVGDGWLRFDWMARQGVDVASCAVCEVEGTDMEPTIPKGAIAIVDRSRTDRSRTGVFMLRIDERRLFRRFQPREGGGWVIYGDNPQCQFEEVGRDVRIVGQVMWSGRDHANDTGPLYENARQLRMELGLVTRMLHTDREQDVLRMLCRLPNDKLVEVATALTENALAMVGPPANDEKARKVLEDG